MKLPESRQQTPLDPEVQRRLDAIDAAIEGRAVDPDLADLASLAEAVREERPLPGPEASERLDRRIKAQRMRKRGWAQNRPPWPVKRPTSMGALSPQQMLAPAAVLATLVIAAGVGISQLGSGGPDDGTSGQGTTAVVPESAGSGADELSVPESVQPLVDERASRGKSASAYRSFDRDSRGKARAVGNRRQDRDVDMRLSTDPDRVRTVADRAIDVTRGHGGVILSSRVAEDSKRGSTAGISIEVPTTELDATVDELTELAAVDQLSERAIDVTKPFITQREQLGDARAERRRILEKLSEASDATEIEALRDLLADARRRIANQRADFQRVARRANIAQISLSVVGNGDVADDDSGAGGWGIGDAIDDALTVLRSIGGGMIVALAALLPLTLAFGTIWLAAGAWQRHRRERALDSGVA